MTLYKRVSQTDAATVTAYRKNSGRRVSVPIVDGQYAEVPDDAHHDSLAESNLWEEAEAVPKKKSSQKPAEEPEEDEESPAPEGIEALSYRDLQAIAKEQGINATQSRKELVEQIDFEEVDGA